MRLSFRAALYQYFSLVNITKSFINVKKSHCNDNAVVMGGLKKCIDNGMAMLEP